MIIDKTFFKLYNETKPRVKKYDYLKKEIYII